MNQVEAIRLKINKGVQCIMKKEAFHLKDARMLRKNSMDDKKGSVVECVLVLPWPYRTQHKRLRCIMTSTKCEHCEN